MIKIIDDRETPAQRQARIDHDAPARARIAEIDNELFALRGYTSAEVLKPLDEQGQRKYGAQLRLLRGPARVAFLAKIVAEQNVQAQCQHEAHFAALRKERESLLASLSPTGERAGHLVIGQTLGTTLVRASENDYRPDPRDAHGDDPLWRFAAEQGWPDLE